MRLPRISIALTWRGAKARVGIAAVAALLGTLAWAGLAGGTEPASTYWAAVEADAPVAQYRLSDAAEASTLADSVGSDSAVNSAITLGGAGPFPGSKSGAFDGEAFATLGSGALEGASEFTAEAWIDWTGGASYDEPIFDFGSSATNNMYLTPASTLSEHEMAFVIQTSAETSERVTAPELKADGWHFLAVSETSSGTLTLYLDGEQVGQVTGQTLSPSSLGSVTDSYLGKSLVGAPGLHGALSNVAFYGKALSGARIEAHYQAGEFPVDATAPTISGSAEDEAELTAHAEDWTGLAPISFGYQWLRCNSGGEGCSEITGAGDQNYSVAHEDVSHTLRVEVTGTNAAGDGTSRSAPTSAITARKPSNSALPAISGTPEDGQTLSASTGSWSGTPSLSYAYQWQRCDGSGESCSDVSGATGSTYNAGFEDLGSRLRVRVTATNVAGAAEAASTASAFVAPTPLAELGYASEFGEEGTGDGQFKEPFDVAVGVSGDLFVLDRGNDRVEKFNEADEYLGEFGEEGSGGGQLEGPDALTVDSKGDVLVLDSGNERVEEFTEHGDFLRTIGEGLIGRAEGIAVDRDDQVWVSASSRGELVVFGEDGEHLKDVGSHGSEPGQIGEPQGLAIDAGGHVWVADYSNARVEQFNEAGEYLGQFGSEGASAGRFSGPYGIAVDAGHVFVSEFGYQHVEEFGETGDFIAQLGVSGSEAGELGFPVGLAAGPAHDLLIADAWNNRVQKLEPEASGAPVNLALPSIYGSTSIGSALEASTGVWRGSPRRSYAYQWQRCNESGEECADISGATSTTYELEEADHTSTVRVIVTATNSDGSTEAASATSEPVGVTPLNTSLPTISGTAEVGQELTADPGSWEHAEAFAYQWQRCNTLGEECENIAAEASNEEYRPVAEDGGHTLRVIVTAFLGSSETSATSLPTAEVPSTESSFNTAPPGISGVAQVGQTLSASPGSWEPPGTLTYAYQWERCDEHGEGCASIEGATSTAYEVAEADIGSTIRVTVTATDPYTDATASSEPTDVVTPVTPPTNTLTPTISGVPTSGKILSAEKGEWSTPHPPLTYAYQWQRCDSSGESCSDISGASSVTYTLGSEDTAGHTLRVVVTATDSIGVPASSTSAPRYVSTAVRVTEDSYDANGNLESQTDGNGHTTKYEYGPDNEQTKVTQADGSSTKTGYDEDGRVTSQTDGNGHTTKYDRNVLGEVTEVTDPLGRKTTKEYDDAGNLTSVTDALGRTSTYRYDPANRLLEKTYSDGTTPDVEYEYDADGNRIKMVDGTGTSAYHYDELDRLTEATDGHGDSTGYEYDLANDQTKIIYPNGEAVERTFDNDGRLASIKDWLGNLTSFAYDPDSNLTSTAFPEPTGETDHYAYDLADEMTEANFGKGEETLASLAYGHDAAGQVASTTSSGLPGEESIADSYDDANRLTKSGSTAYEYDGAGNPTMLGSSTAAYDEASQLEHADGTSYSYDEVGERTKATPSSGPATSYGYDQAGNLTAVDRGAEGETSAIEDSYGYDGDGLRTSETSGAATKHLAWDESAGLPLILGDDSYSFVYGPADTPIEQIDSEGHVTYLHHDQQGATRLLTGEDGSVQGATTYDAYGKVVEHTGSATSPLGYDGQYTDGDTSLIYLRARTYDPSTGQFTSRDPLAPITGESYSYAEDDPRNAGDPTGLFTLGEIPFIGGALEKVATRYVGFWDGFTQPVFGGTAALRSALGVNGGLDECSSEYLIANRIGGYTLDAEAIAPVFYGGATVAGLAVKGLGAGEGEIVTSNLFSQVASSLPDAELARLRAALFTLGGTAGVGYAEVQGLQAISPAESTCGCS
jgi:RHS repeat-associated protein